MKKCSRALWKTFLVILFAFSITACGGGGGVGGDGVGDTPVLAQSQAVLVINASNDKPGPVVEIRVNGWDVQGNMTINEVLSWGADDNTFSNETVSIRKTTRILRLTFNNDLFGGPGDLDRNAFIDYFMVNNILYEAENFDRTGGLDPLFPGCTGAMVSGRMVADCGNQGDWVEYDLHPGNPVGPQP